MDLSFSTVYVFIPLIVGIVIQAIKVFVDVIQTKRISYDLLIAAGGFPSTHAGLTTSLLVTIILYHGIDNTYFMISMIFAILVWYDAFNVRYESGRHAHYINALRAHIQHLFSQHSPEPEDTISHENHERLKSYDRLTERIGHTITEVIGGIVISTFVTIIVYYLMAFFLQ